MLSITTLLTAFRRYYSFPKFKRDAFDNRSANPPPCLIKELWLTTILDLLTQGMNFVFHLFRSTAIFYLTIPFIITAEYPYKN